MATLEQILAEAERRRSGQTPEQSAPQDAGRPGFAERIADNLFGLDNGYMSAGEKVGQALNNAGESMTFGIVGDEASALASGVGAALVPGGATFSEGYDRRLESERASQAQFAEENPWLSLASEAAGALVLPGAAVARGGNLLARMAASAGVGAAGGATYGFMEGEGGAQNRAENALQIGGIGAGIGAAIPVVGRAVQGVANRVGNNRAISRAAQNAPTTEQLRQQARALYSEVDNAGAQIRPEAFERLRAKLQQVAEAQGLDLTPGNPNTPRAAYNLNRAGLMADEMTGAAGQNPGLPFNSLDQYRRSLNPAARNFNEPADQAIAIGQRGAIDDFVDSMTTDDVLSGDVDALQGAIGKARELWGRMRRSEMIDDAFDASEGYLGGQTSGIRNRFGILLRNKKYRNQFSDAEQQIMRRVINGTLPERVIHLLGNGLGNLGMMGSGAAMGGFPGFLAGAAASGVARQASEAVATRQADIARRAIASGQARSGQAVSDATRSQIEQMMRQALRPGITALPQ